MKDFERELEESYGWPLSKKDVKKLMDLAVELGCKDKVVKQLRDWSHEVKRRPAPIDSFIQWRIDDIARFKR